MKNDKLFRWVNAASRGEREEVARAATIGVRYLIQMGRWLRDGEKCFPHYTADAVASAIAVVNARCDGGLPVVTWYDLAEPCRCSHCANV